MMTLDTALKNFADAFARGSKNFGALQFRAAQPIVEPIPLGPVIKEYFAKLLMTDGPLVAGVMHLQLWTLDELETNQHGWRWIRDKSGRDTEDPAWNKDWIVIADRHGDALAVDSSTPGGAVFGNIGSYNFKISDDLASFFQVMAEAILVEVDTYGYEVRDDDLNPLPSFLDEVRAIARRLLGAEGEAGFMEFFFG